MVFDEGPDYHLMALDADGGQDVEDLGRPSVAHGGINQGNLEIGDGNKS